jgi:hypothetical protein
MATIGGGLQLFDEFERSDGRSARYDEPRFAFLNRVRSPYWTCVRDLLELWFSHIPPETQADIRGRFRSSDDRQNGGALWELYVHESLRVEGFTLTPHPEMPGTARRPDFLAQRGDVSFYVEATVSSTSDDGAGSTRRVARMNEALNKILSPDFFLWVRMYEEGGSDPPVRSLRRDLEAWLATLDPDVVAEQMASAIGLAADAMPQYQWQQAGWRIGFRAFPVKAEHRGRSDHRPVGLTGPGRASYVDAITPVRRTLEDKASCYGDTDRPYLIAVLCEAEIITDDFDIEGALFGHEAVSFDPNTLETHSFRQQDGFWTGKGGARERVSGVLTARSILPWTVADIEPLMWHNPWAEHPIPPGLPWASVKADLTTGVVTRAKADRPAHERFGLPAEWPGPGDPFPDDA